jgi:hypothetical protein
LAEHLEPISPSKVLFGNVLRNRAEVFNSECPFLPKACASIRRPGGHARKAQVLAT